MMEYSCPQSHIDITKFDWDEVTVGRKDTHPQGTQPTDMEFEKVWSVHELVKEQKDKEA